MIARLKYSWTFVLSVEKENTLTGRVFPPTPTWGDKEVAEEKCVFRAKYDFAHIHEEYIDFKIRTGTSI